MMPTIRSILLPVLLLFTLLPLQGQLRLPVLVGDHMVLQRDTELPVWGWATPGQRVRVSFMGRRYNAKAGMDGKWQVQMQPAPAGGPYEMTISGGDEIVLKDILVGDVWLASGQSNMEWPLNNINASAQEMASADLPGIRLFTVKRTIAFDPRQDADADGWKVCSPKTAGSFSAVAFLFGRELHQRYQVPIGLIHSSWGGTTAQAWTSPEGLKPIPGLDTESLSTAALADPDFEAYRAAKASWWETEGQVDRGRPASGPGWEDPDLDHSDWAVMRQPGNWYEIKGLKRFGGVVWLRKTVTLTAEQAGKAAILGLGNIIEQDSAFVNGSYVGSGKGYEPKRRYEIPVGTLHEGQNVIAVRQQGRSEFGGLFGAPTDLFLLTGTDRHELAGDWHYRTGPDLSGLPELPGIPDFSETMPQSSSILSFGMLDPLIPYSLKGAIWYQGESNASNMEEAVQYADLFPAMIRDWRRRWGYEFPFLFVQLANFMSDQPEPADYPWARLRESQAAALELPNTGMAVTIDIGNETDIHPRNKQDVAKRLSLAARHIAYGEDLVYSGPGYRSMEVQGRAVRLTFEHTGSGLEIKDKYGYLRGFAIAGADRTFHWARARLEGNQVVVESDAVAQPVAVRYNWGNSPDGNLYNAEGIPAVPFRTDTWEPANNEREN